MSQPTSENAKQRSLIDRVAFNYFIKMVKKQSVQAEDDYHILNDKEVKAIHQIRRWALAWSAALGVLGVLVLYLPIHFFPALFPSISMNLPWWGPAKVPVVSTIYSIVLVVIEVYFLTIVSLQAVHKMAKVCGFPNIDDPDYEKHLEGLYSIGMERESTEMANYGINPMAGLNKYYLMLVVVINRLKGTITNLLIKLLLKHLLGRVMLRLWINLAGIPVYAFWNAWATNTVLKEAKVRIMAPNMVIQLTDQLYELLKDDEEFKDFLFDALQFIAVIKRKFHHNHYFLVEKLILKFDIETKDQKALGRAQLIDRVNSINPEAREGIAKLFLFGMIIDGKLSLKEKKTLQELQQQGLITFDWATLKSWERSFVNGQGLEELLASKVLQNA
ncbi:LBF_2804 family protein [Microscilla marina]|nr:hypothetical protein [Microscilla marina]